MQSGHATTPSELPLVETLHCYKGIFMNDVTQFWNKGDPRSQKIIFSYIVIAICCVTSFINIPQHTVANIQQNWDRVYRAGFKFGMLLKDCSAF